MEETGSDGHRGSFIRASTPASERRPSIPVCNPETLIREVIADIKNKGYSAAPPFQVGRVEERMSDFAKAEGVEIGSTELYFSAKQIAHALRPSKQAKGLAVSETDIATSPGRRAKMSLYFDKQNSNFIYSDGRCKYIVHPNYEMKLLGKIKAVNFITAQSLSLKEKFNERIFIKI